MVEKKNNNVLFMVVGLLAVLVVAEGLFLLHLSQKNNELSDLIKQESRRTVNGAKSLLDSPFLNSKKSAQPFARSGFFQYDPFRELQRMHEEIDRFMNGVLQSGYVPQPVSSLAPAAVMAPVPTLSPNADYEETEDSITLHFDMPGLDKDKIKVRVENGMLTVEGERKSEKQTGDASGGFYSSEVQYGSYSRSMSLPPNVDGDKVEASYDKGVLTLIFPKRKGVTSGSRTVPIV